MPVQVVIPMAGEGSRFVAAGYATPKPLLPVHGVPMYLVVLANVLSSETIRVIIVSRPEFALTEAISQLSRRCAIDIVVVEVRDTTSGPAATVEMALPHLIPGIPVIVANSDQYVDFDIDGLCEVLAQPDFAGAILAMEDSDPKWSYVSVDDQGDALMVREKEVISKLATVGIYGFSSPEIMSSAFGQMYGMRDTTNGEYYVAPSYNYLIAQGFRVSVLNLGPIGKVMFGMGIPRDYQDFLRTRNAEIAASSARVKLGLGDESP